MGRTKKVVKEESITDWPFEIDNSLRSSKKTRVAFMSSQSRTYFPEDPGVSRFGIQYSMNCAPGDVPNPKYFPSDDRLQKPISTKGYGIGGLTGPRFEKEALADNPAPNAYQEEISFQRPKINNKSGSNKKSTIMGSETPSQLNHESVHPPPLNANFLRRLCLQNIVGFGAHLSVSRFGRDPTFNNVGVGYYDLRRNQASLTKSGSFGQGPYVVVPPTLTRCNYKGYDKCFGCEVVLRMVDYYRTRMKIPDPNQDGKDEVRTGTNEDERLTPVKTLVSLETKKSDKTQDQTSASIATKLIYVSLCRNCYCKGMRGESKIWDRAQMIWLFRKTRHCSYIHDHSNIPEFTHKTSCNFIRKVQLKEALMAKYYKDACERVLKQK